MNLLSFLYQSLLPLILVCSLATSLGCKEGEPGETSENDSTLTQEEKTAGSDALSDVTPLDTAKVAEDAEGKYTFRLAPKVGEVYGYRVERRADMSLAGVSQSKTETYDITLKILSVNDDRSLVLGVTYDRVKASISIRAPMVDSTGKAVVDSAGKPQIAKDRIDFDTRSKAGKDIPGGERYRAFIGRQVLVTMEGDGRVQDVANVDPILNATLKSLKVSKDTVNPKALDVARLGFRTEIGVLVSQLFFTLAPDSAVTVGASWTRTDSVPVGGLPASASVTVSLKNIRETDNEQRVELGTTLKTSTRLPKKNLENELYSMKIDKVDVSGQGSWTISFATGFPINRTSTIRSTIAGTAKVNAGQMKGQSQKMTSKESNVTSVRRTLYRPAPSAGE